MAGRESHARRAAAIQAPFRLILRPCALAHRPEEPPVAAACIMALLVVFTADILTPVQVAFSALGLIPLIAAMWLLSGRLALTVGAVAVGQLIVSGALGALSLPTVASESTAYVALALICRLYAGSVAALLPGTGRLDHHAGPQTSQHWVTRTGGVRRGASFEMASLTAREQQVTRLAAQGYTAREIGNELHIGRRTVETHLANAYDKLGIRSKRELIRTLAEHRG